MTTQEQALRAKLTQLARDFQARGERWEHFARTENISATRTAVAVCIADEAKRCAAQLRVALGIGSAEDHEFDQEIRNGEWQAPREHR